MIFRFRRNRFSGAAGKFTGVLEQPRFLRSISYQALLTAAACLAGWYLFSTAVENLRAMRIASGFAFLLREAGFEIGETTILSYSAADTYLRAVAVGFLNTFRVATLAIIISTLVGIAIGLARLSPNWLLAKLAGAYVEVMRNVPLVVQLFFWYAVITESLPAPAEALHPWPGLFLSNRGFAFPTIKLDPLWIWLGATVALIVSVAPIVFFRARSRRAAGGKRIGRFAASAAPVIVVAVILYWVSRASIEINYPSLSGFNFVGGGLLSPEFAALLIGLALYTAAFIGEIVRAGILAVDRGQFEAAYSLGHSEGQLMRFIILPQALRVIVPPVTSQYLNCTKNSSLAVAIGYPDLVSIVNTTINQTGQAIEGIAIIMIVYLTISLVISAFMNGYNRRFALRGGTR